jgi:hypothetical protein
MVNLVQNPIFGRCFQKNKNKTFLNVVASKTSLSFKNNFAQKNLVVDNMEVLVSITMPRYGIHDYFFKWHK